MEGAAQLQATGNSGRGNIKHLSATQITIVKQRRPLVNNKEKKYLNKGA
jgi:hypothetical protein